MMGAVDCGRIPRRDRGFESRFDRQIREFVTKSLSTAGDRSR